ncbi:hypothetical protein B0H10DRAFT_2234418 [Mycena sp. CBHHK59/15]|nr:hypothetical protein B0H10DRAFT_2234418 [Mycena sp. CBHHK59/15]
MARQLDYLLSAALDRAAGHPLSLEIRASGEFYETAAFELLVKHSEQWRNVNIWIESSAFRTISVARGHFPLLESLQIRGDFLNELDVFEIAPLLNEVSFRPYGAKAPPKLPWDQLLTLTLAAGTPEDLCHIITLMRNCSRLTEFKVAGLDLYPTRLPLVLPFVTLEIQSFSLTLRDGYHLDSDHSTAALGQILANFTLPSARELHFDMLPPERARFWPQVGFLAFASRSSCGATLKSLQLHHLIITDVDLLQCLSALPLLETLAVSDYPAFEEAPRDAPDHIAITDSLLRRLSWTAESTCLAPHLTVFSCTSLLRFDDRVLLDFVTSRARGQEDTRFEINIRAHAEHRRDLDLAVVIRLTRLKRERRLLFSIQK